MQTRLPLTLIALVIVHAGCFIQDDTGITTEPDMIRIVSTFPAPGQTDIFPDSAIVVRFSNPLHSPDLETAVSIKAGQDESVACDCTLNADEKEILCTPARALMKAAPMR
jgi:hypothetical protein